MKNIGLKKGTVKVVPHQREWHTNFQKEKKLILSLQNKHIKVVEHVGSTSIQKMPAKPIIDIIVGIDRYFNTKKVVKDLASIGYQFRLRPRRYQALFVKMDREKETHYLKVLRYRGKWWYQYMHFKNILSSNKKFFEAYKGLKLKLMESYFDDRKAYTKSKSVFIKKVMRELPMSRQ
jgi:GrpB-like predicted nucleotidyltransferase (UPF0157 family)